jgi:hypothetical protein
VSLRLSCQDGAIIKRQYCIAIQYCYYRENNTVLIYEIETTTRRQPQRIVIGIGIGIGIAFKLIRNPTISNNDDRNSLTLSLSITITVLQFLFSFLSRNRRSRDIQCNGSSKRGTSTSIIIDPSSQIHALNLPRPCARVVDQQV